MRRRDASSQPRALRTRSGLVTGALALAAAGSMGQPPSAAASTATLPVVVVTASGAGVRVAAEVGALGGTVLRRLDAVDEVVAQVPAGGLAGLAADADVRSVTPDAPVHLSSIGSYDPTKDAGSLYDTTLMTGAQSMWKAGYTGQGVTVALIDTGVVPVNGLTAAGKVVNGPDLSFDSQAPNLAYLDTYGHGTHMAGIIAGKDDGTVQPYAGNSSAFIGMAPDAQLLSVKVADSHGSTDVSQVVAGLDWVLQHRTDAGMNVRVINLSFGTDSIQSYLLDPLAHAVEDAWKDGVAVVAAVGNAGFKATGVDDPADDPYVIAVGAADTHGTTSYGDDTVATFSQTGDGVRNPDLVAPGVHIASLRDPGSYIDLNYGSTGDVTGTARLFRGSGTSQATAVVSGAAALLISQRPGITPDQLKKLLTSTATPISLLNPATAQGAGEVNLGKAMKASTPSSLLSTQVWSVSTGLGTLEGSRGTGHLVMNSVALQGEIDIMGNSLSTSTLAQLTNTLTAWVGGVFNGATWSGSDWTGHTWAGHTWADATWTGHTWAGNTWSGITWSGNTWSSGTWSGNTWSANDWSGHTWAGNTWSNASWS